MLKIILEEVIPRTLQDVVLVYVSVTGLKDGQLSEENYVRKFYPKKLFNADWSAIQITTASSLCSVIDIVMNHPEKYKGAVRQEEFSLAEFTQNQFGECYKWTA